MTTPDPYAGFAPKTGSSPTATTDPNAVTLYEASDAVRREIANQLKAAGYKVPTDGKYTDALVNAYTDAVQRAAVQSAKLGRAFSVGDYLAQEKNTGGAGANGITNYISDPTQAAGTVRTVVQQLLNREATDKEITALTKILVDAQKRNPYNTKNGVRTGGLDDKEFLTEVIQSGKYDANKKAYPKLLQGLSDEIKKKKESVEQTTAQGIGETARLNGLNLTPGELKAYADRVKNGEDVKTIESELRSIASTGQPDSIKKMMAGGTNLDTIYAPYKRVMANSLDLDPNTISLDDPTLRSAIGPEKEMSLYDFKKAVRKDNRWKYSQEANDEVTAMVNQVKRDFGFMG